MGRLSLTALDCRLDLDCPDPTTRALAAAVWGGLGAPARPGRRDPGRALALAGPRPGDVGEWLLRLDREVVVALQRRRPDLYFLHAAVLARRGRAVALVAPSGTGKSTLAWALAHHGFRYLSDELAPVEVGRLVVHPVLRALGLKAPPPGAYPLPPGTVATARGCYVPVGALPGGVARRPVPLAAVVFLARPPGARRPVLRPLAPAETAARLLAGALNPLAHAGAGLDPALAIARRVPGVALRVGDLAATCRLLRRALARRAGTAARATCGSPS